MNKLLKFIGCITIFHMLGCSQEEHVILINESGSSKLFAISLDNNRTSIGPRIDLFSRQILRYKENIIIKLEIDGIIYNYETTTTLTNLWKRRASRNEIILLLSKNKNIYYCDSKTSKPLAAQPSGFPLVAKK